MTIKKRLFISNILMTVIPYIVSMATILSTFTMLDLLAEHEPHGMTLSRQILSIAGGENFVQGLLIMLFVLAFFVAIMILTNRFLTKFVFKRIKQPLELLSDGVKHISDGDLDFRIEYGYEDEFRPVCEAFNSMAHQLKQSHEMVQKNEDNRKELIAGISHDLRSPLTSIKAFAEGLIDRVAKTPEAQERYLLTIKQKTEDINNVVSQLFLYSKMDIGSYPTYPENLDIGEELAEYVAASTEEYAAKGLKIELEGLAEGVEVFADPLQLRSVFANILGNSAKYKKKENVVSKITCTKEQGNIVITFEDDGEGVAEEAIPYLFDIFYRTDPSRRNPNQGSGLGLAIVRKAIEQMGGTIKAENAKLSGLRIIIEIPIARKEAAV